MSSGMMVCIWLHAYERSNPLIFFIAMSTIAVILVNVDDLDEYMGNMSDEEFDKKTEEYIREEVGRGNFFDTRIRYAEQGGMTSTLVSVQTEEDVDETHFRQVTYESVIIEGRVDDLDSDERILSTEVE